MDCAARFEGLESAEVERFGDDPLSDECGITMDEQWKHRDPIDVVFPILLGPDATFDHWVHELEVARVERERHVDVVAARGLAVERVAEVVLHIAAADIRLGVVIFEASEDLSDVHFHDVDHHVQTPAMGHPDDHFLDAELRRALREDIEHRDHALSALERKALGPRVLRVEKLLEDFCVGQLGEDSDPLFSTEVDVVPGELHSVAEPVSSLTLLEEGVLDANGPRVGILQSVDEPAERFIGGSSEVTGSEDGVGVDVLQSVALEHEVVARKFSIDPEWVEVSKEMAANPIGVDERRQPRLQFRRCQHFRRRRE